MLNGYRRGDACTINTLDMCSVLQYLIVDFWPIPFTTKFEVANFFLSSFRIFSPCYCSFFSTFPQFISLFFSFAIFTGECFIFFSSFLVLSFLLWLLFVYKNLPKCVCMRLKMVSIASALSLSHTHTQIFSTFFYLPVHTVQCAHTINVIYFFYYIQYINVTIQFIKKKQRKRPEQQHV